MRQRLIAFVVIALCAMTTLGQQVDSSRIKKKTNGGITGDAALAVAVAPYRGTSAPGTPVTGQLWCDTTTDPCIMKQYDGATWESLADNSVPIQNDLSSFPGSPTDGQAVFVRNPPAFYVYDATNARWYSTPMPSYQTGANVIDNFTGTTITAPASALTLADNATAGNATVGTHSCKVTFANSSGGETTMSAASNTVTFTASHSFDWTSIPTGGTGTTQRRIYCTKAGAAAGGPWYWIHTVNDNSTTSVTAHAGLADANLVRHGPKSNYSAALDARWTVTNQSSATTSGGCGSTGAALACSQSSTAVAVLGATSDTTIRSWLDLSSYNTGDYTIQFRVDFVSVTADTSDGSLSDPGIATLRVGTANDSKTFGVALGINGSADWTTPLSLANPATVGVNARTAVSGARNAVSLTTLTPWPRTGSVVWIRWVKKGNFGNFFSSSNGRDWNQIKDTAAPGTEGNVAFDLTSANPTRFEFELFRANTGTAYYYFEVSNFTLTVN